MGNIQKLMKNSSILVSGMALSLLWGLSSCVMSDTVEPVSESGSKQTVVLDLTAPEALTTRADNDHVLRFTAKLFEGTGNSVDNKTMQRKELIQGEEGEAGVVDQIIFELAAGKSYTVQVFADYVPKANKGLADDGGYKDEYYNTRSQDRYYTMLATPQNTNSRDLSLKFFNNDNYDCFSYGEKGVKGETANIHKMVLTRSVAKVRVVDSTNTPGEFGVKISSFKHVYQLVQGDEKTASVPVSFTANNLELYNSKSLAPDEKGETELFYYYTFGTPNDPTGIKNDFTFTLTGPTGKTETYEARNVPVQPNYITKVKGDFFSNVTDTEPEGPGEDPGVDPTAGNIILNISLSNEDWNAESKEWNYQ